MFGNKKREELTKVIAERDQVSQREARERVDEVLDEVRDLAEVGDWRAEDAFINGLGLEIDYLF